MTHNPRLVSPSPSPSPSPTIMPSPTAIPAPLSLSLSLPQPLPLSLPLSLPLPLPPSVHSPLLTVSASAISPDPSPSPLTPPITIPSSSLVHDLSNPTVFSQSDPHSPPIDAHLLDLRKRPLELAPSPDNHHSASPSLSPGPRPPPAKKPKITRPLMTHQPANLTAPPSPPPSISSGSAPILSTTTSSVPLRFASHSPPPNTPNHPCEVLMQPNTAPAASLCPINGTSSPTSHTSPSYSPPHVVSVPNNLNGRSATSSTSPSGPTSPNLAIPPVVAGPVGQHRMPGSAGNFPFISTPPTSTTTPIIPTVTSSRNSSHSNLAPLGFYSPSAPILPVNHHQQPLSSSRGSTPDTSNPGTPAVSKPTRPIALPQHKHLINALRSIKRLKDAGPFLSPVDWKALNIPDYPHIIKSPMDLSTIEHKMQARDYSNVEAILTDFNLMVDNCVRYNGEKSPYATMAYSIRKSFDRHLEKLPPVEPPTPAHIPVAKKVPGGAIAPSRRVSGIDMPGLHQVVPNAIARKPSSPATSLVLPTAVAAGTSIRRRSDELDATLNVIRDLFRKQHAEFAAPFLSPVDRKLYPQYYEIIKTPMDFGTIRERLESGTFYGSAQQAESDAMQVFKNCYKFNPPGNPIRHAGMKLENLFKSLWSHRMAMIPPPPPPPPPQTVPTSSSAGPSSSSSRPSKKSRISKGGASRSVAPTVITEDSDSDSDDGDRLAIQSMERTIADLQRQLDGLKERRRERKRKRREARAFAVAGAVVLDNPTGAEYGSSVTSSRRSSAAQRTSAKQRPSRQSLHSGTGAAAAATGGPHYSSYPHIAPNMVAPVPPPNIEVTFDMKRELSERINDLPGDRLQKVLNIIQETMGATVDGSEEIELDINLMDNHTVYRLWQLVTEDTGRPRSSVLSTSASSSIAPATSVPSAGAGVPVPVSAPVSSDSSTTMATSLGTPVPPRVPPQSLAPKFMSLSAALGSNSSDDDGSDDESSSGSESD